MDIILVILAFILLAVGLVGCVLPVIPGPPLGYVGVLLLHWSKYARFSDTLLIVLAIATIFVTVLDYYLPVWLTSKLGGSRRATIGSALGLVAGMFIFPPMGIIVCPFLGALVGELINDHSNSAKAFKVAMGSFLAFICGTGLKLVVCGVMIFYCVKQLIV